MSPEQLLGSAEFGDTTVIADLEAGLGTLSRLEQDAQVDVVLVVVEPTAKSLEVGMRALDVIRDKKLGSPVIVANRLRDEEDHERVRAAFPDADIVAVPDDPQIMAADRAGVAPLDHAPDAPAVLALAGIAERL